MLTPKQESLLRHAVGADSKTPFYRNHYCTDKGSEADGLWIELVEVGLAVFVKAPPRSGCCGRIYAATDEGKQLIRDGLKNLDVLPPTT